MLRAVLLLAVVAGAAVAPRLPAVVSAAAHPQTRVTDEAVAGESLPSMATLKLNTPVPDTKQPPT